MQALSSRRRLPRTLIAGMTIIVLAELLLFADVRLSHRGAIHTEAELFALNPPTSSLGEAARWMAVNMTAVAWVGYLLVMDGLLKVFGRHGSPVRRRPHHFALLCLASVFIWCVFDAINFNRGMRAWIYIGLPPDFWLGRLPGYLLAFAAIVPGMLLAGQLYLDLDWFNWAYRRPTSPPAAGRMKSPASPLRFIALTLSLIGGAAMFAWPLLAPAPLANLTLWSSLVFLLDPLNYAMGRPSMWRDWFVGNFARTLAAFAGGLTCGFLWEFWNYFALTKWTYFLPFLGRFEHYKYFEMPLPGLIGFLPFGLECWVMWQLLRIPLDGLAEPLPDDRTLL